MSNMKLNSNSEKNLEMKFFKYTLTKIESTFKTVKVTRSVGVSDI